MCFTVAIIRKGVLMTAEEYYNCLPPVERSVSVFSSAKRLSLRRVGRKAPAFHIIFEYEKRELFF
jgi:hypothetical protein